MLLEAKGGYGQQGLGAAAGIRPGLVHEAGIEAAVDRMEQVYFLPLLGSVVLQGLHVVAGDGFQNLPRHDEVQ
jgi:hypothetical protein